MKRLGVMVGLASGLLNGTARSQENFAALLLKNSLSFTQPNEFSAVAVLDNPDVRYQFAMRSTVAKAEIRYAIFPSSNNDEVAAGFLQTICLNISNGKSQRTPARRRTDRVARARRNRHDGHGGEDPADGNHRSLADWLRDDPAPLKVSTALR